MKQKRLRKQLGTGYFFEQRLSAAVVANLLETLDGSNHFLIAASLAVGAVKLEAVVYWNNGKYSLGYDLLVKDTPLSPDWICYENLPDPVRYNAWNLEREMFLVLDRAVDKYGLSYMECRFPKLDGSTACIPLMAQMMADTTGIDLEVAQSGISVSTTAYAWENFGLYPDEEYTARMLVVYEAPDYVKEELKEKYDRK